MAQGTLAMYQPGTDTIYYSPDFLNQLYFSCNALEPGASVLLHEVGHMWANKTGRMSCIGHSSSAPVWTQEFQADSYAGAVPSSLGGSPQPSIQIYNSVLASWTQSHSPGSQRAQVFTNGFDNGLDDYCGQVGALARSDDTAPESDARFHELLSMDAWTQLREIGQR